MILFLIIFCLSLFAGQMPGLLLSTRYPLFIHDIFIFLIFLWGSWKLFRREKKYRTPVALKPIIWFCIFAIISLLVNYQQFSLNQISIGSLYLLRWIFYTSTYVILTMYLRKDTIRHVRLWLYISGCIFTMLGFIQVIYYPSLQNITYLGWDPHFHRLVSTFLDPNFAGIWITITFLLGLSLYKQIPKLLLTILQALHLIAIALTYSRSSYLAFIAGILCWVLITKKWKTLLLFLCLALAYIAIPRVPLSILRIERLETGLLRFENWKYAVGLIWSSPIFGHGFNTVIYIRPGAGFDLLPRAGAGLDNSFLYIWAAAGIGGFLSFLAIFIQFIRFYKNKIYQESLSSTIASWFAQLAAICVFSFFNNGLFYPLIMIWIWLNAASIEIEADTKN